MSFSEFTHSGFLNRHIRFNKEGKIHQGILFQDNFGRIKSRFSQFTFVPTSNLIKWREAKNALSITTQLSLSWMIDVEEISGIEFIKKALGVI